jgi:signal transduction histidine kinase
LRWQITLWAALSAGLALVSFGAVVAFEVYSQQVEMIDSQLMTDAGLVIASGPAGVDRMEAELARLTGLPRGEFSLYGYAIRQAGPPVTIRAQPEVLAGSIPPGPEARQFLSRKVGDSWLRIAVLTQAGTTVVLATSLHEAIESVEDLLGAYGIAFPLVLLVVAGGSWWIARRALRPIVEITAATASITADRLHERLTVPAAADEISRHILVLNGMLNRLERSFEQANRFATDAAHELRTPLTIMRGQIEDALRSGAASTEQEGLLVGLLEETTGLQKIAENLLMLARFDIGKNPLERSPLDLSGLVREAVEDAELLAAPREIEVSSQVAPGLRVNGDSGLLRRVLLNLLDNAVKFNRPGGRLCLELRAKGGAALLSVSNTGSGIPAERQAALFQRFFRVNSDRSRDSGGGGLGLSLCREIVSEHAGKIELSGSGPDWTEFTVSLPCLPDAAP